MIFDDFNYKSFNPYVLINEPEDPSKKIKDLETRLIKGKSSTSVLLNEKNYLKEKHLDFIDGNT